VRVREEKYSDTIGRKMQAAWLRMKKAQSRMWSEWMIIGEGLMEGRRWAMAQAGTNRPEGKGYATAFSEWLTRYRVNDMDNSDRAKLLQIMEELPAIEEWRANELSDHERRTLNHPTLVWRKWNARNRERSRSRTASFSAREMGRTRATVEQQQERIAELEQELALRDARIAELEEELVAARSRHGKKVER
jgi:hypothetical protein